VTEALLLVDVLKDFCHEDGDALLESYRRRHPVLVSLLSEARARGIPVVYVNDRGEYAQPGEVVREAVEEGKAGELVAEVAPANDEPVLLKDAYSAFEGTELPAVLAGLGVERVLVAGAATEMCVFHTALDARRLASTFQCGAMRPRAWTTRTRESRSTISSASWGSRSCALRNSRASGRVYERWREHRSLRVRLVSAAVRFRGSRGLVLALLSWPIELNAALRTNIASTMLTTAFATSFTINSALARRFHSCANVQTTPASAGLTSSLMSTRASTGVRGSS